MADNIIKRFIQIFVDSDKAISNLDKTEDSLNKVDTATTKVTQSTNKLNDSAKNAQGGLTGLAKGFTGVGLAMKALGIGLIISALGILKDLFLSNQKVVDGLNVAMTVLKIAFNDLFKFIETSAGKIIGYFKKIFSDPKQALIDFGNAIKANLIERITSFIDTLGFLSAAIIKVFKGDFKGALEETKKAGKEVFDVMTGVSNTFDKTVQAVGDTVDALGDYIDAAVDTAKANVELQKSSEKAILINQGLIEKYDALAEKLRQIRDDDTLSIAERIKANEKLGVTLDKQAALMNKNDEIVLKSARNNLALNNTHENQLKLIEAQNKSAETTARIEALRSEQIANRIKLLRELGILNETLEARESAREIEKMKAAEAAEKDEFDRLNLVEKRLIREQQLADEKLARDKERYKEGTQARVDAEQEYADKKQQIDIEVAKTAQEKIELNEQSRIESLERMINDEESTFKDRLDALEIQNEEIEKATHLSEEERTNALEENTKTRLQIEELAAQARDKMLSRISASLNEAAQVLGENTAAGKAAAIAATTIDTYRSATAAYAGMVESIPGPGGVAAGFVAAAISVAAGLANVKKILAVKTKGGGGDASTGGASTGTPAQFNIIGSSQANELGGKFGKQTGVIKAQVVSSEVSSAQALDRNRVEQSVFLSLLPFIGIFLSTFI
jgi:hypothetical protein